MSLAACHGGGGNGSTIERVALTFRQSGRRQFMVMQIVIVGIVAVVFLVRLAFALYDRPSRSGSSDR